MAALAAAALAAAAPPAPRPLGGPPLCEASALAEAPDGSVLVADNELQDRLFRFALRDGALVEPREVPLPPGHRPRDLEALAAGPGGALWLVGSHSRDARCQVRAKRARLRWLVSTPAGYAERAFVDGAPVLERAAFGAGTCLETLFTDPPPAGAAAVCRALVEALARSCRGLDVEGAVNADDGRLWLGWRAPLAGGRAVLVRLAEPPLALRFDAVALLDLEGRGVRALARADDALLGLAGPPEDGGGQTGLFSLPLEQLAPGASPTPALLRRDLPPSAEGLLVRGRRGVAVVDGARGTPERCEKPSLQVSFDVPDAPASGVP